MDEEVTEFLQGLEKKRGTKIMWKTFSTWFATTDRGGIARPYGVFLYRAGDEIWFEDFEHRPYSFFGFPLKKKKDSPPFHPYESSFPISEIKEIRIVTRRTGEKIAEGSLKPEKAKKANLLQKIFSELFELVMLEDGTAYVFQILDRKGFLKEVGKELV